MGILTGGLQLMGGMMQAGAAQAEGRKAKEIADHNAYRLEQQGRYQARQVRKQASFINGQATVDAAGNGLMIAGSAMDIIMDSAVQGEIDAANLMKNANDEAHVQRLEGEAAQQRANNAAMSAMIGGFSGFMKSVA